MVSTVPAHVDHLVIGAGFGGVAMAIGLQEDDEEFLVVDKADGIGGTWWANTYPGAACDVPSQLYSFSFAPNPDWSRAYSPQDEIQAYVERVARDAGVLDRFRLGVEVLEASWDADALLWRVRTSAGDLTCRTVIAATGGLSTPRLPAIEGLESFTGPLFHTARWDHGVDLNGKRVAVIGTGASAIQVIPAIQPEVARLDVYQRTPPWVIPRNDRAFSAQEKRRFRRVPGLLGARRGWLYYSHELLVPGITRHQWLNKPVEKQARANLARGVADPGLRRRLTPDFQVFCKRILLSDDYYPAMSAANVDLVTDPIARITPNGVLTADGVERPADVIVVATGFQVTDPPIAHVLRGRDGHTLAEAWSQTGMAAYKGTTVPGFPNFFLLTGPNTGQGHTSVLLTIEATTDYVRGAIHAISSGSGHLGIEPRVAAYDAWNADIQRRMPATVWQRGGCSSWYQDEHGRVPTQWPRTMIAFRRALGRFDPEAYAVSRPPDPWVRPERTEVSGVPGVPGVSGLSEAAG